MCPTVDNNVRQKKWRKKMDLFKRFIREEDGMEMVEWAIVGVVFAVAAALFWGDLATEVDGALGLIEGTLSSGS
jgi:Flp pilus assembly pilin Flp